MGISMEWQQLVKLVGSKLPTCSHRSHSKAESIRKLWAVSDSKQMAMKRGNLNPCSGGSIDQVSYMPCLGSGSFPLGEPEIGGRRLINPADLGVHSGL